jgi:hypothetical protein
MSQALFLKNVALKVKEIALRIQVIKCDLNSDLLSVQWNWKRSIR